MSETILIVMLASWAGCFWLGFQTGRGRSEQRSRHEFEDFERRFKIVSGKAVDVRET